MRVKKIDIGIKGLKESLKDFSMAWGKMAVGEKIKKEENLYTGNTRIISYGL
jgi:hypothetical protein